MKGRKDFLQINKNFQILSFLSQKLSPNPRGAKQTSEYKLFEMAMRTMREIMMKVNFYEVNRLISQSNWNTVGELKPGPQIKEDSGEEHHHHHHHHHYHHLHGNSSGWSTIESISIITVMVMTMVGAASQPLPQSTQFGWQENQSSSTPRFDPNVWGGKRPPAPPTSPPAPAPPPAPPTSSPAPPNRAALPATTPVTA